jgi:hypothetical protein
MMRFLALGLMLGAASAEASWEFAGQGTLSSAGVGAQTEVYYSPQGFWAVGALAKRGAANGWHPQLAMRGSFELFRWVPRLTLRAGYLDQLTWGVDAGYDYFVMRQMSVRLRAGWGSDEGLEGGLGLAWFPFD